MATIDTDPEGVVQWARSAADPQKRSFILARAFLIWRKENFRAASDWFANASGLTEAERTAIETHE